MHGGVHICALRSLYLVWKNISLDGNHILRRISCSFEGVSSTLSKPITYRFETVPIPPRIAQGLELVNFGSCWSIPHHSIDFEKGYT
jgi:hypothetical protein